MARYSLEIRRSAARELEGIDGKNDRRRLVAAIRSLADVPRPAGAEKLAGAENAWRIRRGRFRVIYEIFDRRLVVIVVRIGDRKEVYR